MSEVGDDPFGVGVMRGEVEIEVSVKKAKVLRV